MGRTNSRRKRPSRLHCSMIGIRFSSINFRVLSRTSRSSGLRRESNSIKSTPLNLKTGIYEILFLEFKTMSATPIAVTVEEIIRPVRSKLQKLTDPAGRVNRALFNFDGHSRAYPFSEEFSHRWLWSQ